MIWAEHVTCIVEMRYGHKILVGEHEGKRALGRLRRKWKDHIETDIEEIR